jgi:hypothetical protein
MEMRALNLPRRGDVVTGANIAIDGARRAEFLRELKAFHA